MLLARSNLTSRAQNLVVGPRPQFSGGRYANTPETPLHVPKQPIHVPMYGLRVSGLVQQTIKRKIKRSEEWSVSSSFSTNFGSITPLLYLGYCKQIIGFHHRNLAIQKPILEVYHEVSCGANHIQFGVAVLLVECGLQFTCLS